jgi:hypothetical protein
MDLGRLAALRASLSSAVGAAARAASDQVRLCFVARHV